MVYNYHDYNEQVKTVKVELETLKEIADDIASYWNNISSSIEDLDDELEEVDE